MKAQLPKSLVAFLIFNCTFLFSSYAQIVYTDVNPEVTSSGTYNLDLNNDGVTDFEIFHFTQTVTLLNCGTKTQNYIRVSPSGNNQVNDYSGSFTNKLLANVTISSTGQWSNTANQTISYYIWTTNGVSCFAHGSGQWYNSATDGYLGLKLIIGVNTYYGWARLNVASAFASSFTIKDYAHNSSANQSILAGQTCSPQATIKANGPIAFCSGGSVVLSSKNSGNTLKYQWKKNNININGATNKNYTATSAGDYKVKVTDTINNCYKTSGIKTITVPCRNSNDTVVETLEHLSVYPNPATNSVTIKFPSDEAGEIRVMNLLGKTLIEFEALSMLTIDVSDFPTGVFIVRWSCGQNIQTQKFSVVK